MARIRTIKPDFFMSDDIGALTVNARLLYISLWCHVDCTGKCKFQRTQLMVQCMPFEMDAFDQTLEELASSGHIVIYEAEDKKILYIPTFTEHQRPHHTEKPTGLPEFNGDVTVVLPLVDGDKKVGRERKGKEGKGKEDNNVEQARQIFSFWQDNLNHQNAKFSDARRRLIEKQLKLYSERDLKKAIAGCTYSAWHMGENPSKKPYDSIELILRDSKNIEDFIATFEANHG